MNREEFHAFITHPKTSALLDGMLAESQRIDAEIARRTHYAIQRIRDGAWWVFDDTWSYSRDGARRFGTMTMAQLTGERDCPAEPVTWTVQPVEGA